MNVSTASERAVAKRRAAWTRAQKARSGTRQVLGAVRRLAEASFPAALLGLWTLGVFARLFLQDRWEGFFAHCYYATPPAVLAALTALVSLWWLLRRRRRAAAVTLVMTLGCAVWTYRTAWFHNPPAPLAADNIRVVFWNTAWGVRGWDSIAAALRAYDPDVIAMVEARASLQGAQLDLLAWRAALHGEALRMAAFWRQHFPEHESFSYPSGMTLLVRGQIKPQGAGPLRAPGATNIGNYIHAELETRGQTLQLVLVDVVPKSPRSRQLPLEAINRVLQPLEDRPVLVVGDFNTPTDSRFFGPLRQRYLSAFELAGQGYAATWPVPLPVLTLDQAWFSPGLRVARCRLDWTTLSDHRPLILDLSLAP